QEESREKEGPKEGRGKEKEGGKEACCQKSWWRQEGCQEASKESCQEDGEKSGWRSRQSQGSTARWRTVDARGRSGVQRWDGRGRGVILRRCARMGVRNVALVGFATRTLREPQASAMSPLLGATRTQDV